MVLIQSLSVVADHSGSVALADALAQSSKRVGTVTGLGLYMMRNQSVSAGRVYE